MNENVIRLNIFFPFAAKLEQREVFVERYRLENTNSLGPRISMLETSIYGGGAFQEIHRTLRIWMRHLCFNTDQSLKEGLRAFH